jgi:hypothetical protein
MASHSSSTTDTAPLSPAAAESMVAHRPLPAWAASALLHALILILLALSWQATPRSAGTRGEPDRGGDIALVDMRRGSPEYFLDQGDETSSATAAMSAPVRQPSPLPGPAELSNPAQDALPTLDDVAVVGDSGAQGLPDATGMSDAGRASQSIGGQTTTGVFGATGTGSKFVYVFDCSGSMSDLGGRPLAAAKAQLLASLQNLEQTHQFQIVFYNHEPRIFNPNAPQPPRLLYADQQTKRLAERYVGGISAVGGTKHWSALKLALGMNPDVIFFLTDGLEDRLTPDQMRQVQQMHERQGTQIHTIEFGSGPSHGFNFLTQIARQTTGKYVYVDVTRLPSP